MQIAVQLPLLRLILLILLGLHALFQQQHSAVQSQELSAADQQEKSEGGGIGIGIDGGQPVAALAAALRSRVPPELMNPVRRSQLRQRLLKLKLQREAEMLRNQKELISNNNDGDGTSSRSRTFGLSLPPSLASEGGQLPFHHRNCFFSPVNCHLPVVGARQRSAKRRVLISRRRPQMQQYSPAAVAAAAKLLRQRFGVEPKMMEKRRRRK